MNGQRTGAAAARANRPRGSTAGGDEDGELRADDIDAVHASTLSMIESIAGSIMSIISDGVDAQQDDERGQADDDGVLPPVVLVGDAVPFVLHGAEDDALQHPEDVAGGEHDAEDGEARTAHSNRWKAPRKTVTSAMKPASAGQPEAREAGEDHARGDERHLAGEAAEAGDFAGVGALVHEADHHEHQAGDEAVGEHLVGRRR